MLLKKISLQRLVQDVHKGKIVSLNSERKFAWNPMKVKNLLASVLRGDDIGSILALEYNKKLKQKVDLISGVKKVYQEEKKPLPKETPDKILLDGQQQVAALYYALYKPYMPLKKRSRPYTFYLDVEKALKGEWDQAVFGISIGKKTRDEERFRKKVDGKKMVIEFRLFRNFNKFSNYFQNHVKEKEELTKIIKICKDFNNYKIDMIYLPIKFCRALVRLINHHKKKK